LPPLEAMASGVPVIVSQTTSFPEVCGDAALYVDPVEPKSIASAINSLLNDPQLYAQKKQQGIIRSATYSWEKTAHAMMRSIINTTQKSR